MKILKIVVSKDGELIEERELLLDRETVIGRSADLVLSHKSISRRHASIDPVNSCPVLKNLAKDWGTRVNEREMKSGEQVKLSPGDKIQFGKSSKIYTIHFNGFIKAEDPLLRVEANDVSKSNGAEVAKPSYSSSSRKEREADIAEMTASVLKPVRAIEIKREDGDGDSSSDDEGFGPQPLAATGQHQSQIADQSKHSAKDPIEELAKRLNVPVRHSVDLSKHTKMVLCLSSNPSGNRVVTGSQDGSLKIFDFGGMDSRQQAFKEFAPESGVAINDVCHSPSGDRIMVVTSNAQPMLYDKEGSQLVKFIRGDMYLTDLTNTKGHASEVVSVAWHPRDNNMIITGGVDGTLRSWDVNSELYLNMLRNKQVMKVRAKQGGSQARVTVNSCCYSPDGMLMVAGCADGSVHIWDDKNVSRPKGVLRVDTGAVTFVRSIPSSAANGRNILVAKTEKGCVYFWDLRAVHSPSCVPFMMCQGCPNDSTGANVAFNSDYSLMCVPTVSRQGASSSLEFYKTGMFKDQGEPLEAFSMEIGNGEKSRAGRVLWHQSTNQILVAMSNGATKVFFDPELSKKGVLLSADRAPPRKKDPSDFIQHVGEIYAPHALPMFKEDMQSKLSGKRKGGPNAKVPEKGAGNGQFSHVKEVVSEGTKFILSGRKVDSVSMREENPRDALIKQQQGALGDVAAYVGNAYKETQPDSILASKTFEQEEEELRALKRARNDQV